MSHLESGWWISYSDVALNYLNESFGILCVYVFFLTRIVLGLVMLIVRILKKWNHEALSCSYRRTKLVRILFVN